MYRSSYTPTEKAVFPTQPFPVDIETYSSWYSAAWSTGCFFFWRFRWLRWSADSNVMWSWRPERWWRWPYLSPWHTEWGSNGQSCQAKRENIVLYRLCYYLTRPVKLLAKIFFLHIRTTLKACKQWSVTSFACVGYGMQLWVFVNLVF